MKTKIGVNGRFLNKPFTGIGQYTKNLLKELAKLDLDIEYLVIVPDKIEEEFPENVVFRVVNEPKTAFKGVNKLIWEQYLIGKKFKEEGVDLAFFPYPANPWFGRPKYKVLLTVHDVIPWEDKRYIRGIFSRISQFMARISVKKADRIFSVSKYSAKKIADICEVNDEIVVVNNGVSEAYTEDSPGDELLQKLGLVEEGYFLYCGGFDVRKNIEGLLEARREYLRKSEIKLPLVIVGEPSVRNELCFEFSKEVIDELGLILTGFLKEKELALLYKNCLGFINLSTAEGFNIPVVEAACMGAPLLISDIEIHREIAKGSGIFVNNENCSDFMLKLETDESFRKEAVRKSLEICGEYNWKKSALKFYNAIKDLTSRNE